MLDEDRTQQCLQRLVFSSRPWVNDSEYRRLMWLMKIVLMTFVIGVACGSFVTWKLTLNNRKNSRSIITHTCCTYTWWTQNPRFRVDCDGLDGARHG